MRIRVCGSSTLCVLVAPGRPHASPLSHAGLGVGGGLLWTDGWEGVRGHYCDGGGERGGVRLKNEKAGVSITASPIFPLNHCSDTHCLLQHMLMVVKTELDAQPTPHPPPPPHPDPHLDLIIPALPCPTR